METTLCFPVTKDFQTAALFVQLARLERHWDSFSNDPMSEYAPIADFAWDHHQTRRRLLGKLLDRSHRTKEGEVRSFAIDGLMEYCP